jgi:hypothetical protein
MNRVNKSFYPLVLVDIKVKIGGVSPTALAEVSYLFLKIRNSLI